MSMQHVQYVLLLLVLAVQSDQFQILQLHALTQAVHSYVLLPAMDLPHFFPQYPSMVSMSV